MSQNRIYYCSLWCTIGKVYIDPKHQEKMNILFVCNQNQHRSKTAEELFKTQYNTKSAGLYNEHPLTEAELSWADVVIVMEDHQRSEIAKRFPLLYLKRQIFSLNVPDRFSYNQQQLISLLKNKVEEVMTIQAAASKPLLSK